MLEMFYCGLCTYSSITKAHLGVHAYFTHNAKPVPWYKGNSDADSVLLPDEFKNLVQRKRYFCALTSTCQFSCLTDVLFRNHLKTHEGCGAYRCHLCFGSAETCGRLLHHYQIDHGFFTVQCLYCDFGSNDDWIVMRHVMEQHSRRPFRMLLRNGDTPAVCQELRLLMQEYLTRDPVKPTLPCAQLSLESTQVNVTLSAEAMPEVGPVTLGHSSLEVKPSLDQSCKGKCTSILDPRVEEKLLVNHAASSDAYVNHQSAGRMSPLSTVESLYPSRECTQHFAMQPEATLSLHPSAHQDEQTLPLEPGKAQPLRVTETSSLAESWHLACNAENCTLEFRDIFDYLNHLTECHPLQSSFLCPKCDLTVSSAELSAHLVEKHSGFLFCPYQDCSFGSRDQCGLDSHIIQSHQIYQEENRNSSVVAGDSEPCITSTASSKNYTSTGSVGFTSAVEICKGRDKSHEVNLKDTKVGLAIGLYFCGTCSTDCSTLSCYLCHMASEHLVPFICGHCFKPYKRSRCLLMHAGCLHLGQPFSVFCLNNGKVTDIGLKVAPVWIDEAQQYLRMVHHKRMQAKGKTMLKNLKRAITYISSTCLENVPSQTGSLESSVVPHGAFEDLKPECEAQSTSLQNGYTVDTVCSEDSVLNGQSVPSRLWYDSAPPRSFCNGSSNSSPDKCLNQFGVVRNKFKGSGVNLVDASPLHSQNTSSSNSRPSITRSVELKILASVYIDASSCKKVDGKIVFGSEVMRKLCRLSSTQLPMSSSLTEGSGSLCTRASEGIHICSECSLTFSTFEALAKHIAKLHNLDFVNGFDLASAVLSVGDNWDLQGSVFKHDVKQPRSTAQLHFKRIQSEGQKRVVNNRTLVCLHSTGVKVPYSEFSREKNLNPVVKLFRLPMIKNEPKE